MAQGLEDQVGCSFALPLHFPSHSRLEFHSPAEGGERWGEAAPEGGERWGEAAHGGGQKWGEVAPGGGQR